NEILADVAPDNATTPAIEGDANRDGTRSADDDEFVELLNNSSAPLDLSGIVLADGTSNRFTFLAGTMLAAGRAVIVFGGGAPPTGDAAFGNALIHLATSLGLNDGGDTLTVKLPQSGGDVIIATQPFGSGGSGAPPAPSDQSLTRAPDAEINLAGGGFVPHAAASNSAGRIFSPGTRLDGTPFSSSPLSRIEIVPAQATIEINATQSFNARAFAVVNGTESEVSFVSFRWEASDQNKAALVPPTGTTTVATALAAGTVTISARAGGLQANATLNINPPPPILTSVQLTPLTASIVAGNTQQFTARALDQNNQEFRGAIFSFTSSDTSVATIDAVTTASDGSTAIATVTGGNAGAAQINANAASGSTSVQSNAAMLNVTAAPMLTRIEVTPAEAFVSLAASRHFTARAFDQNNQELSGVTFNWTTTDESIASVDQAGLATGLRTGQTTLRAASGQVSSNPASLQVTAPAIPTAGQVIINEALISFSTSTTQTRADFLELYNPTEHTLDISGLVISYRPGGSGNTPRTVTLPGSIGSAITLIRPRAFFLVINGGQTFGVSITTINGFADGFDASTFNSQTNYFDLNNTTGGIRIELNGVKLDGLTYQGGSAAPAPPFNAYGEGALFSFTSGTTNDLIRSPASADTDANAADFRRNGSTASVTPKAANP
ncbi:MAG: lamin tail domain-containing protein, partial [Pyrinomonadaceae bacterium]|nr:lamin tail domain-containing protein [Pyrinomonadaceae bacterium]